MSTTAQHTKTPVLDLHPKELEGMLASLDIKKFRAKQILAWVYQKDVLEWESMTDLPASMRQNLQEHFTLNLPDIIQRPGDREAEKFALRLQDGQIVESVHIRGRQGGTFCLSTQVGCDLSCRFCASGQMPFKRNLTPGEILAQVLLLSKECGRPSNIVYMGMGEPFLNYDATMHSLETLQDNRCYGFGARRITVSTAGIVPEVYRFAQEGGQVNLAVSLHATTDTKRGELMPIARLYTLRQLLDAAWYYTEHTGRRISFEYVLIPGVNDSHHDADRLVEMLKDKLAHLNLIPFNPVPKGNYKRPGRKNFDRFLKYLKQHGVNVTPRRSAGTSVHAACGQLAGSLENPA